MRFRFIAAEKATFPVRLLCRTLQVSRAGFYAWHGRAPSARAQADERLRIDIAAIHATTRQRYGSPRIHAELVARGCRTGRKRVARLMRVHGLAARCRRRFRVTTQSRHPFPLASNVLARRFERLGPGPSVGHGHDVGKEAQHFESLKRTVDAFDMAAAQTCVD